MAGAEGVWWLGRAERMCGKKINTLLQRMNSGSFLMQKATIYGDTEK